MSEVLSPVCGPGIRVLFRWLNHFKNYFQAHSQCLYLFLLYILLRVKNIRVSFFSPVSKARRDLILIYVTSSRPFPSLFLVAVYGITWIVSLLSRLCSCRVISRPLLATPPELWISRGTCSAVNKCETESLPSARAACAGNVLFALQAYHNTT